MQLKGFAAGQLLKDKMDPQDAVAFISLCYSFFSSSILTIILFAFLYFHKVAKTFSKENNDQWKASLIIAWKEGSICMKLLDNFNETFLMSAFKNVATIVLETIAELGGSGWHQFMTRPWLCSMFHVKVYEEEANPSLHFASYFSHRSNSQKWVWSSSIVCQII